MFSQLPTTALLADPAVRSGAVCAARIAGTLLLAAPPLNGTVPFSLRAAFALALTVALAGGSAAPVVPAAGPLLPLLVEELAIGLLLALPLRLAFEALRHAGELAATSVLPVPSSSGSILDGTRGSAVAQVSTMASVLALMATGGDRVALGALARSFSALPPGSALDPRLFGKAAQALGASYLETVAIAVLPFVAAGFAVQLALALAARAASAQLAADALPTAQALLMMAVLAIVATASFLPVGARVLECTADGLDVLGGLSR